MGLDRVTKTPCGFCFIEYNTHREAEDAKRYLNGRRLCNRPIRVDWDKGNVRKENRYWGRGATGGQVRDEYRSDYDPARGGLGIRTLESLGGQFVRPEARVYGNWAYTPFNVHQKRSTAARKLPDMDQSYEDMADAGGKKRRRDG
ncbi:Nuclear cap-binding protein subunit 2 [Diplonema papillatum]|nr:Nuclear cap-binding protein subunit 2 [Diplonema papillatum]